MRVLFALALAALMPALGHADLDNKYAQLTAAAQTATMSVEQHDSMVIQLSGTAFVATAILEASANSIPAVAIYVPLSVTAEQTNTFLGSITANGTYRANVGGYRYVRLRVSAYTSGTLTINMQMGTGSIWPLLGSYPVQQAVGISNSAYTWSNLTPSTSPINGTVTTGVNAPFMVTLAPNFGGDHIKFTFHATTYTPAYLTTSLIGENLATSSTALTYGPFAPGMYFSVLGIGSPVTGLQTVYVAK